MYIIKYLQNNGYRETFDSLKDLQKYIKDGNIRNYISSIKEISNVYEDKNIDKLLNKKVIRRDNKFTFEEMIYYSDLRIKIKELKRLAELTDNIDVQSYLLNEAQSSWSDLCKWLDELI